MRKHQEPGDASSNHSQPSLPFNGVGDDQFVGDAFAQFAASLGDSGEPADRSVGLARAAMLLSTDEYPALNIQRSLTRLDDLADDALQSALIGARTDFDAARRLAVFLAETHGFRGAAGPSYYDPRNSYLSDVLETRVGIPITLSLVLIEVGRRLGLPLTGIGFPGHFLVGCGPNRRGESLLLDPHAGGVIVDRAECEMRLQALGILFDPEVHLAPISTRDLFLRMLGNLHAIYANAGDLTRALRVIERTVQLDASRVEDYRHLALVCAKQGESAGARTCLRAYLDVIDPACRSGNFNADAEDDSDDPSVFSARELLSYLLEQRALRN